MPVGIIQLYCANWHKSSNFNLFVIKYLKGYFMNKFAERLKELREEKNMSELQLAKVLGVSSTTINRWERGLRVPNLDSLVLLARFFDVSIDYLCGLED